MQYDKNNRDFSRIPETMKQTARWVGWFKTDDGRKLPVNPRTLNGAMPNNPQTWTTFDIAEQAIDKPCYVSGISGTVCGIGFMLGDGWTGIDLDGGSEHGRGEISTLVINDFAGLGTYSEYSQSGAGYHFIGYYRGQPFKYSAYNGVEIYTGSRYFAITGNVYKPSAGIADITETLPTLYNKYIGQPKAIEEDNQRRITGATVTAPTGEQGEFIRENIESMLAAIDPDCPRDIWYRIGAAIKAEGFDISVFDAWSAKGQKYAGFRDIQGVWNSFRRGKGVNGGFIVKQAQLAGWKPDKDKITESYKPKTAQQDFSGLVINTVPAAQPATGAEVQPAQPIKSAVSVLDSFLTVTGNKDYRPIPTGLQGLDTMLNGGFDPGTMTIMVAEPGTGKTALIMQIAENMSKSGLPVMVFNLEMSEEQLVARSLSRLTAESVGLIKDSNHNTVDPGDLGAVKGKQALYSNQWGLLPADKREKIADAVTLYRQNAGNLYLITDPITEYSQIIEKVYQFKAQTGKAPIVIVDYLQLLFSDGKTSAVYSAKDIILGLKQRIAREMQTAVIMISATGRDKAKKGKMDLQSAFGSSFIEYSADYQFGLEKVDPDEIVYKQHEKPLMLSLVKGRMDMPNNVQGLFFAGAYSWCREIDKAELRTVRKLVESKEKELKRQEKEDNQKEEQTTGALVKKKLT